MTTNPHPSSPPATTDPSAVPRPGGGMWVTDGGLETTLVFLRGIELPDFAAFPLLATPEGREELTRYYTPYLDVAASFGAPMVLDTPTWRANLDWGARLGYDPESLASINRRAVRFVSDLAAGRAGLVASINGVVGPRGDGYVATTLMSAAEAARYHALQVRAFAAAGADMVTAVTMTHTAEAIGIAVAADDAGLPAVVSFTVETDGRLPSGQPLGDAIHEVDAATAGSVTYFMVNCAHPSHFEGVLEAGGQWRSRIAGVRANASRLSHAELDEAPALDRGDPVELADDHRRLLALLPNLTVVGGCCGTDHEHVAAIVSAVSAIAGS